jgi:uncharacterized protein YyaL (SSP411 family)
MANRLSREKSPYLRQHAENPVDWYPWGDEAFSKARAEGKPVFLSIGYSSCHWCHVMARESFSDQEVAAILNEHFVAVKVDREERPDIDSLYMAACQSLTGQGGWPLSVFLTPSGAPFFAGTYFPKRSRGAMPGLIEVLTSVVRTWTADRARIDAAAEQVTETVRSQVATSGDESSLGPEVFDRAFSSFRGQFDDRRGGFGGAPKFPTPHRLSYLLRYHQRAADRRSLEMVSETLRQMRYGGIFDQVGLGFHRYAVDERWRLPHFEKMLVDQALLTSVYIEAFLVTKKPLFGRVAREVLAYVLSDMTSPEGAFWYAEDSESGGGEGRYYLWTSDAVESALEPDRAGLMVDFFGVKREGNISAGELPDGANVLYVPIPPEQFARLRGMETDDLLRLIDEARQRLAAVRAERPRPTRDDKVITAANGLMIGSLAAGYRALGDRAYLDAAVSAARFVSERLTDTSGGLLRRFREGDAAIPGFLEDYAFYIHGLIELYEAALDVRYLEQALSLSLVMIDRFEDRRLGGLFTSMRDGERLIADLKEFYDGAGPSPNSVAADDLLRLFGLTGDIDLLRAADRIFAAFSGAISAHPEAAPGFLIALERRLEPGHQVVIVGERGSDSTGAMIETVHRTVLPAGTLLFVPSGDTAERRRIEKVCPFVEGMGARDGRTTAYICEGHACREPLTDPNSVREILTGEIRPGKQTNHNP